MTPDPGGRTAAKARDFLAELERRLIARMYEVPPTIQEADLAEQEEQAAARPRRVPTLIAYAEDVIERRFEPVLATGTMGIYRAALRAWKTYFGKRDGHPAVLLDKLTPSMWLDYRSWRATHRNSSYGDKKTVSARTLNADQQCIVRVLNEAVLDGHLDANPLAGMRKLREPRQPRRYLTQAEVTRVLLASDRHLRPLVLAALYTGCRKSEILALTWSDIDFEAAKLVVHRKKTGTSDWLDLHPALALAIKGIRKRRPGATPTDFVFLSRKGTNRWDARKAWRRAIEGAGLGDRKGLGLHCLRHTFATHFLSSGGAVTDLQAQLGHANLQTTQRYADLISERRRKGVMALAFGGVRPRRSTAGRAAAGQQA